MVSDQWPEKALAWVLLITGNWPLLMKRIRYSKYVPDPAGQMSLEDLLGALSDYLLQSGFQSDMWYELPDAEHNLDELRRALEQALMEGDQFDEDMRERLQQMAAEGQLDELIEKLIQRMQQEDYISIDQPPDPSRPSGVGGQVGAGARSLPGAGYVVKGGEGGEEGHAAVSGRNAGESVAAGDHDTKTVAVPGGEKPEGGYRGQDHIPFLAVGGAEIETG